MSRRATLLTSAAPSAYEALVALDPEVLEAIPAAVYICAADGRHRPVQPAGRRTLGAGTEDR